MSRIVAIDYGRKRTGIAVSDTMQIIANGLTTVPTHELLDFITNYVKQESVERIIIGLPKQMNNEVSENMKNIEPFVRSLKKRLPDMPVEYVDERFTSVLAHRTMLEAGLKKKDRQNKALVERATRYITAAGSLLQDSMRVALSCTDTAKARAFAGTLSRRYISSSGEAPHEEIRLLSALTLQGIIFYSNTIAKLADTTVVLDDEYGAASRTLLYALREEALQKGHNIVTCYCSMSPYEKIEHLFIPALRLCFVTSNSYHPIQFSGQRTIHCTRFCNKEGLKLRRKRLHFNKRAVDELFAQASSIQKEAKECHDALEQYYIDAVDFTFLEKAYQYLLTTL